MKNERDHPCYGCKHFYGYEDIETLDTLNRGHRLHVGIPICSRVTYELAMGRCDEFSSMIEHNVLGHDINEIWGESDAPDTPRGRDRLFNMTKFTDDFMIFDDLCNERGLDTPESIALYNCFITNEPKEVLE